MMVQQPQAAALVAAADPHQTTHDARPEYPLMNVVGVGTEEPGRTTSTYREFLHGGTAPYRRSGFSYLRLF